MFFWKPLTIQEVSAVSQPTARKMYQHAAMDKIGKNQKEELEILIMCRAERLASNWRDVSNKHQVAQNPLSNTGWGWRGREVRL